MWVHLVSLTKGAMRMVMVSQLDPPGTMRGLITTLNKQRAQFLPVARPSSISSATALPGWSSARSCAARASAAGYRQLLKETVEQGYARLIGA